MKYGLLLGAGFSRNWGGWLASEAFEYLIGYPKVDLSLKDLLWKHRKNGGFEAALAELQEEHRRSGRARLDNRLASLQDAIVGMFSDMDEGFGLTTFEFQDEVEFWVKSFLVHFDAIFTLNQDLLLERHYLNEDLSIYSHGKWRGWQMPGMMTTSASVVPYPNLGEWKPDPRGFIVAPHLQPYFKLHGSINWVDVANSDVLVFGANKMSTIDRFPILKSNHDYFKRYLAQPDTRLMVIGYSFSDDHINKLLREGVSHGLSIFVIDPLGVDVMDANRNAQIYKPSNLAAELWPHVIGSSRRSLREIFGSDRAEHEKVMRFFD